MLVHSASRVNGTDSMSARHAANKAMSCESVASTLGYVAPPADSVTGRQQVAVRWLEPRDPTAIQPKQIHAPRGEASTMLPLFVVLNDTRPSRGASHDARRDRPTVSTPLTWQEINACHQPEELVFTADEVLDLGDLLADLDHTRTALPTN